MELRLLPSFAEGSAPQWDGLTHFIYYFAERTPEEEAAYMVSVSSFEEAVKRFFTEFDYTHQSSGFFTFSDKGYTAIGWDDHGGKYYKLTALSEDSKGIYSAAFDGFSIAETDYMGEEPSVNMKAVKAKAEALGEIRAKRIYGRLWMKPCLDSSLSKTIPVLLF